MFRERYHQLDLQRRRSSPPSPPCNFAALPSSLSFLATLLCLILHIPFLPSIQNAPTSVGSTPPLSSSCSITCSVALQPHPCCILFMRCLLLHLCSFQSALTSVGSTPPLSSSCSTIRPPRWHSKPSRASWGDSPPTTQSEQFISFHVIACVPIRIFSYCLE